jgi:hypothetical protein
MSEITPIKNVAIATLPAAGAALFSMGRPTTTFIAIVLVALGLTGLILTATTMLRFKRNERRLKNILTK